MASWSFAAVWVQSLCTYALKKCWQDRYVPWRDCREEVVIWGPAVGSSITTTTYFVKSTATNRCFYTDDVVIPTEVQLNLDDLEVDPGGAFPHLPERDVAPVQPWFNGNVPTRRLRTKTAPPRAISFMSMLHIEGENKILEKPCELF